MAYPCQPGCAACCIAPSISSSLPKSPLGKPAGQPCPHLTGDRRCELFFDRARPAVCASFQPSFELCGAGPAHALAALTQLETSTRPD
jgi:Fe-S-cluster containining protein